MKRGCYWMVGRDTPHPEVVVEVYRPKGEAYEPGDYRYFATVNKAERWARWARVDLVWDSDSTEFFAND